MKTAEEWMNRLGKSPNNSRQENELWKLSGLSEKFLPQVAFWNSVVTELDIQAIQLDAFKAGMTKAAEIVNDYEGEGMDSKSYYDQGGDARKTKNDIEKLILTARDNTTTL